VLFTASAVQGVTYFHLSNLVVVSPTSIRVMRLARFRDDDDDEGFLSSVPDGVSPRDPPANT